MSVRKNVQKRVLLALL